MKPFRAGKDVRAILCNSYDIYIVDLDMEETCGSKGDNRRSHVAAGDDLYPENICNWTPVG